MIRANYLFLMVLRSEPNTALRALQLGALRVLHFRVTPKVTPLFATLPRQRPRGAARKENARTTEAVTGAGGRGPPHSVPLLRAAPSRASVI